MSDVPRSDVAEAARPATEPTGESSPPCQARTVSGTCNAGPHATKPGICAKGHALQGNQLRRTHGAYSFRDRGDAAISEDLRISADDMAAGIIADKGGAENCSTLMRECVQQERNLRVFLDLLANRIVTDGLFTKGNRVRSTFSKWLETLDRFERLATKIGFDRETRPVQSLRDYLTQVESTKPKDVEQCARPLSGAPAVRSAQPDAR